jgi:hypothetical protein
MHIVRLLKAIMAAVIIVVEAVIRFRRAPRPA